MAFDIEDFKKKFNTVSRQYDSITRDYNELIQTYLCWEASKGNKGRCIYFVREPLMSLIRNIKDYADLSETYKTLRGYTARTCALKEKLWAISQKGYKKPDDDSVTIDQLTAELEDIYQEALPLCDEFISIVEGVISSSEAEELFQLVVEETYADHRDMCAISIGMDTDSAMVDLSKPKASDKTTLFK